MKDNLLALVPARKSSKRLPNKNLLSLGSKLLIDYSLQIAVECEAITCTVCASDSDEILEHAKEYIGTFPSLNPVYFIKLPTSLTTDDSLIMPVVRYVMHHDKIKSSRIDGVVLLQPTSPFRKKEDLLNAIALYREKNKDIFSVVETNNTLEKLFLENKNGLPKKVVSFDEQIAQFGTPVYYQNGSIYVINKSRILSTDVWVDDQCLFYKMPKEYSINIDTEFDLLLAKVFLEKSKEKNDNN